LALAEAVEREKKLKDSLDELLQQATWPRDEEDVLAPDVAGDIAAILSPQTVGGPPGPEEDRGATAPRTDESAQGNPPGVKSGGQGRKRPNNGDTMLAVASAVEREREAFELASAGARAAADMRLQKTIATLRAEADAQTRAMEAAAAAARATFERDLRELNSQMGQTAQQTREANSRTLLTQREYALLARDKEATSKALCASLRDADATMRPLAEEVTQYRFIYTHPLLLHYMSIYRANLRPLAEEVTHNPSIHTHPLLLHNIDRSIRTLFSYTLSFGLTRSALRCVARTPRCGRWLKR